MRGRRALPARAPRPCHSTGWAVLGLDEASLSFRIKIWNGSLSGTASSEQDTEQPWLDALRQYANLGENEVTSPQIIYFTFYTL